MQLCNQHSISGDFTKTSGYMWVYIGDIKQRLFELVGFARKWGIHTSLKMFMFIGRHDEPVDGMEHPFCGGGVQRGIAQAS